jgi:RNase P/RNase MRP subunit p29
MNLPRTQAVYSLFALTTFCFAITAGVNAQVKTETSTGSGPATTQVHVERGEVVRVDGNDLLVKMEDGSLRDFPSVPESTRVTVDGKQLSIHDLKPGMKLERTITTTTTPMTVTTVQTVTGTVLHVMPPSSVTLRLEDGSIQRFTIPSGQKFTINGSETDAWGLRPKMKISATKVVEEPQTQVEHQRQITGTMPPPPAPPSADQPIIIIAMARPVSAPAPTPATQEPQAKTLPKTGSVLPLIGLLGGLAFVTGFALRVRRLKS